MQNTATKRSRSSGVPSKSASDQFDDLLSDYPRIISPNEAMNEVSNQNISVYSSLMQIPRVIDFVVLSKEFVIQSLGRRPIIHFMNYELGVSKCEELLVRSYAKEHAIDTIIRCSDGFLGVPRYVIHLKKVYTNMRIVTLKHNPAADELLLVALTAVIDNSEAEKVYSQAEMTLIVSSLHGMYSITSVEDISKLSTAIAGLKDLDIGSLGSIDTEWMKGRSRALFDIIVGIRLSRVAIEELADILEKSTMSTATKLQLWVSHPGTVLPLIKRKAGAFSLEGVPMEAVKLSDVGDEDLVQCTNVYITQSALLNLTLNSYVYVATPVHMGIGKGKGGIQRISATAAADRPLTGKTVKAIASLNTAVAPNPPPNNNAGGTVTAALPIL